MKKLFVEKFNPDPDFGGFIKKLPPHVTDIIEQFGKHDFEVRIVGGTVRDLFLDMEPRDIDLITTSSPHKSMYVLDEYLKRLKKEEPSIKPVVSGKGIAHGTVKIIFSEDEEYEITSLNFSIHEDKKGKLKVTYDSDWKKDSDRRDFTVNAISMDLNGNIYDYHNGIKDLKEQRVKFIGNYKERIDEDPVMLMRFWKIVSKFEFPIYDEKIAKYTGENFDLFFDSYSIKRLHKEFDNIQKSPYSRTVFEAMRKYGVLQQIMQAFDEEKTGAK
jgi:tRNA nucleotidyltransferase/poly(A) polymerase